MALASNLTQCDPETTKFGKITQNKGHFAFAVQGLLIKTIDRKVLKS